MRLRLGTRASALALAQSRSIARDLEALGAEVELVHVSTAGDLDQQKPFAEVGATGVFVRALEQALTEGRIDLAVHSYKDLPSQSPAALRVAAAPPRADARDRLLVRAQAWDGSGDGVPLARGARVGTASARRDALLRALRLVAGLCAVVLLSVGVLVAVRLRSVGTAPAHGAQEEGVVPPGGAALPER